MKQLSSTALLFPLLNHTLPTDFNYHVSALSLTLVGLTMNFDPGLRLSESTNADISSFCVTLACLTARRPASRILHTTGESVMYFCQEIANEHPSLRAPSFSSEPREVTEWEELESTHHPTASPNAQLFHSRSTIPTRLAHSLFRFRKAVFTHLSPMSHLSLLATLRSSTLPRKPSAACSWSVSSTPASLPASSCRERESTRCMSGFRNPGSERTERPLDNSLLRNGRGSRPPSVCTLKPPA